MVSCQQHTPEQPTAAGERKLQNIRGQCWIQQICSISQCGLLRQSIHTYQVPTADTAICKHTQLIGSLHRGHMSHLIPSCRHAVGSCSEPWTLPARRLVHLVLWLDAAGVSLPETPADGQLFYHVLMLESSLDPAAKQLFQGLLIEVSSTSFCCFTQQPSICSRAWR